MHMYIPCRVMGVQGNDSEPGCIECTSLTNSESRDGDVQGKRKLRKKTEKQNKRGTQNL